MASAPIVVHPPSRTGGRRVTARGHILGLAHSDRDVAEFLRRAGMPDAEQLLDDPAWVTWRGGHAHCYEAA
ncbi:hypothetical protein [Streptomyces sp. NPDC015345]|uniref:hypothetical protein n=1 Tax=Streptomyces sp. NPDC015345 TaxID=3364953 RepID=UPI0036F950E2